MKIKCPFCRNIYDPEACDSTCPACNKKLLVSVFKKKPEGKPGGGPATVIRPPTTITPKPATPPPMPTPASAPEPKPAPIAPMTEFVAPKAPIIVPVIKSASVVLPPAAPPAAAPETVPPPNLAAAKKTTIKVMPQEPPPAKAEVVPAVQPALVINKATQVVMAPPPEPVAPVAPPPPAPNAEKKQAHHGHSHAKAGMDVVISIQRSESKDWDAVIRVPVQVFKLANLIPARARDAIAAEGIDLEELRKAVEQTDHVGRLLDIQTQVERIHIAIEPHG